MHTRGQEKLRYNEQRDDLIFHSSGITKSNRHHNYNKSKRFRLFKCSFVFFQPSASKSLHKFTLVLMKNFDYKLNYIIIQSNSLLSHNPSNQKCHLDCLLSALFIGCTFIIRMIYNNTVGSQNCGEIPTNNLVGVKNSFSVLYLLILAITDSRKHHAISTLL